LKLTQAQAHKAKIKDDHELHHERLRQKYEAKKRFKLAMKEDKIDEK
jgi:hypothetical protein